MNKRILLTFFAVLQTLILVAQDSEMALPEFSVSHGIYTESFTLNITFTDPDAEIHYTLDGTCPNEDSKKYDGGIKVNRTTVIRAVAVKDNEILSPVSTATYLFVNDILSQSNSPEGYPDTWGDYAQMDGTSIADYEMDPEMTSDSKLRPKIIEGLYSLPVVSVVTDKDNLFSHEYDSIKGGIYIYTGAPVGDGLGRGWERPVSFELFGGPQNHDLTVDCGIKMHGGHGRLPEKNPKHSMRLVFKTQFGPKELHYPIFGEDYNDEYNALILRSPFGNAWQHWLTSNGKAAQYTRDMWARSTQRLLGHPASNGLYVHLFINGLYWGMYCLSERIDDSYCEAHFGGKKSHYDVIKVEEYGGSGIACADGDMEKWNEMQQLVKKVPSSHSAYLQLLGLDSNGERCDSIEPLLDIDNFIDYMLINQYGGNTDWDYHNWFAFRNKHRNDTGFRFICWDSELIFGSTSENVLGTYNNHAPTHIFQNLLKDNDFKRRYVNRAQKLLTHKGALTQSGVVEVWDSLHNVVNTALYDESARWGDYRRDVHPYTSRGSLYTVDDYYMPERNRLLTQYFPKRSDKVLAQIKDLGIWPSIEAPTFRINGKENDDIDTLTLDDKLTLYSQIQQIYYTFDGSDPVSWLVSNKFGEKTSSAIRGTSLQNILSKWDGGAGEMTVKAVCKSGSEWGVVAERTFYVVVPDAIDVAHVENVANDENIYDLSGRYVGNAENLPNGLYIINGKKYLRR